MMKKSLSFFTFIFISYSLVAQSLVIEDLPQWAFFKDTLIESNVDEYEVSEGFYYTAYNVISNHSLKSIFTRTKAKIISNSGVDVLSQINIELDTSFQQIKFHHLKIYRGDKIIDRTEDIKFKIINSEDNLGENIYSGTVTANTLIHDLRKGDELEVAYTICGKNPVFGENIDEFHLLQEFCHIDYLSFRLITPQTFDYNYKIKQEEKIKLKFHDDSEFKYLDIEGHNISPPILEESMSFSDLPFNAIELSSFDSWEEVSSWASKLYVKENTKLLDETFKSIYSEDKDLIANATDIVDFIQNNIRYTAVNGGISNWAPSSPSKVLERYYGDCKDKSLLLVHLLNKLGIEGAYPALVNSYGGKNLDQFLPRPSVFNHVIVQCKIEGQLLWIDPTLYLQGGSIQNRLPYIYGQALVLGDNSSQLKEIKLEDDFSITEVYEIFDFSNVHGNGELEVRTIYKGKNADLIRNLLDVYSKKEISDQFKEIYSILYLNVSSQKKLKIEDDYDNNIITIREYYIIEKPWKKIENIKTEGYYFNYEPINIYNYIFPTSCDSIVYSIDLEKNTRYKQHSIFSLPKDAFYHLNNISTENKAYKFVKEQEITNITRSDLYFSFEIVSDQITPEDYIEICKDINQDYRALQWVVNWFQL